MRNYCFAVVLGLSLWTQNCLAEGLCPAELKTLFFCSVEKSKKIISLCQDGDSIQYRFGTKDKVEITLPERAGREGVRVLKKSFPTGEEIGVRFIKGTYSYTVTNYFGGKPPEEFDHLVVENAGKQVADILCSTAQPTAGSLTEVGSALQEKGFQVDNQ